MKKKILLLVGTGLLITSALSTVSADTLNETNANLVNSKLGKADYDTNSYNMYVEPSGNKIAYGGMANFEINLYSSEQNTTKVNPTMYVVLPEGYRSAVSLNQLQERLDSLFVSKKINGTGKITRLENTDTGREVYMITASSGATLSTDFRLVTFKFPVLAPDTDSGIKQTIVNANSIANIAQDVIFVGAHNGELSHNSPNSYPLISASTVGIKSGNDSQVRGIVYSGIERTIRLFTPTVVDTYNVIDSTTGTILNTLTKSGLADSEYDRQGFVDTLDNLGIDSQTYDRRSLTIDNGTLVDKVKLISSEGFSNNDVQVGQTYTISVSPKAKPVTVKYVDEAGADISKPETITGYVGEEYTAEQKTIKGYTFKEVMGDVNGQLSNEPKMITYVYSKDPNQKPLPAKNVTVKYVDMAGHELSDDVILTGNLGETYKTRQKDIVGYTLKKINGKTDGFFTAEEQTITYIYIKNNADQDTGKNNGHLPDNDPNKPKQDSEHDKSVDSANNDLPETDEMKTPFVTLVGVLMLIVVLVSARLLKNKK